MTSTQPARTLAQVQLAMHRAERANRAADYHRLAAEAQAMIAATDTDRDLGYAL